MSINHEIFKLCKGGSDTFFYMQEISRHMVDAAALYRYTSLWLSFKCRVRITFLLSCADCVKYPELMEMVETIFSIIVPAGRKIYYNEVLDNLIIFSLDGGLCLSNTRSSLRGFNLGGEPRISGKYFNSQIDFDFDNVRLCTKSDLAEVLL